jgi:DUF971 family protein
MNKQPVKIDKLNDTEMLLAWNTGEEFVLPFTEIRYYCPCASCVDEHTGERTILRSSISPDIRPKGVQVVGRYALQIAWSDQHSTGMYHFDRLYELCEKQGRKLK